VAHNVCGVFESWDLVPDPDGPIAADNGFTMYLFSCEYPQLAWATQAATRTLKE
jgi:hypothetical protein